jgi:Protein of unknown function (DUF3140)
MTAHGMSDDERKSIHAEFDRLVNMTPERLKAWLDSEDSRSVGMTKGGEKVTETSQPESVGHHMGERILEIRGRKRDTLNDQDFADMRKVVGYIHRHSAQRPKGDITDTRWRKSLMNWGHDPA